MQTKLDFLIERVQKQNPQANIKKIRAAYECAAKAHEGQKRRNGEPYIIHPVAVAEIVVEMGLDTDSICAALLHDCIEDTEFGYKEIENKFGTPVAELVDGVTRLGMLRYSKEQEQFEDLRKMFLAMAKDIRVILIKLADRLHNARTFQFLPERKQRDKALETMEIYAPIAHRLGMSRIKWELEDLSLKVLDPIGYNEIVEGLKAQSEQHEEFLQGIQDRISTKLKEANIHNAISARVKHIYSIYRKMYAQHKTINEIYDICAVRVIVDTVADCYNVLGYVHDLYKPIPGRFKDYISTPKPNGYQSLHTTVIGRAGIPFEVQIRTVEMHKMAEYGVAAHWKYKQGLDKKGNEEAFAWIRQLLEAQQDTEAEDFIKNIKVDLFADEVFVFTPKGEVMALRAGSTPLDFAYAVHTEVGNHCVGAKINGAVAPLTHEIKTGDRVEILTNKSSKPSRDWLKIVKTPSAKSKIRRYFAAATKDDDAAAGRDILAKDLRKRGYGISTPRSTRALNAVAEQFNYKQLEDLFAAVGAGKVAPRAVGNKVEQILDPKPEEQLTKAEAIAEVVKQPARGSNRKPQKRGKSASNGIIVKGESSSGLLVRLAHCCNPVTGDDIVGFITRGRGVSVHRANCPNVKGLMEHPERMIDVEWDGAADTLFQVEIVVECLDRMGLLKDVTIAIGDAGGNILSAATSTNREGIATLRFMVEISDASGLDPLLASISSVDSVYDARRLMPGEGGAQLKRRV